MKLEELLKKGIKLGASDIHLTVGIKPMARINSKLQAIEDVMITPDKIMGLIGEMMEETNREVFEERGEVDFAFHLDCDGFDHRFRVNAFQQRGSAAAVLRIIPHKIPPLKELGLPQELKEISLRPRGLFLVTGPTGSGKSTTLASMIDYINHKVDRHIITLEDPIEYVHRHNESIINQREVGSDTLSFANGLRAALRQDPDIILVGEMRDLDTISTAITAAETGHLVLGTLHTNGAAESIERVINVFPPHQQQQIRTQLGLTLQGVLSQQLIPTFDGLDRALATELLIVNNAVKNLIREGKVHQIESIMQTNRSSGMHTMDYSLKKLYQENKITWDDTMNRANNINYIKNLI
ncbi:twitching motility protein PilT [Orenia metallireducens]|uniref:Twitching motility protein PilT n=1 Tax=Orenia metallireducens TaxID=1413210 RepID=A0A285GVJ4_9FIRM|nr:type IV pilus twitching motility protein PilT [Orenia metallireducens]PRX31144.1 twitching motility protein PilT [Orenia metallireducens]SNY27333.1 twitching motility protein PilT [Orenia metallireducens]